MLERQTLAYERSLTESQLATVREGHLPHDMDDKWFCFVEEDRLYMHRSWTGHAVVEARFNIRRTGGADIGCLSRNADRDQLNLDDDAAADLFDQLLSQLADHAL